MDKEERAAGRVPACDSGKFIVKKFDWEEDDEDDDDEVLKVKSGCLKKKGNGNNFVDARIKAKRKTWSLFVLV